MKRSILQYFIVFMLSGFVFSQVLAMEKNKVPLVNNTGQIIKYIFADFKLNTDDNEQPLGGRNGLLLDGYEQDIFSNDQASLFLLGKNNQYYDASNGLRSLSLAAPTDGNEVVLVITKGEDPVKWIVRPAYRPNASVRYHPRKKYEGPPVKHQISLGQKEIDEAIKKEAAQKEAPQKEQAQKEAAQKEQARQREEAIKREQTAQREEAIKREQARQREEAINRERAQKEQAQKEAAQKEQTQSVPEKDPMDVFPGAKGMTNKYNQSLSILGLNANPSESEIKKASNRLGLKWHPDKWETAPQADRNYAEEVFKVINNAKDYLLPRPKQEFDKSEQK